MAFDATDADSGNPATSVWFNVIMAAICLLFCAMASGLTQGLLSLDLMELKITARSGTRAERLMALEVSPLCSSFISPCPAPISAYLNHLSHYLPGAANHRETPPTARFGACRPRARSAWSHALPLRHPAHPPPSQLMLWNTFASEALPIFLDAIVPGYAVSSPLLKCT